MQISITNSVNYKQLAAEAHEVKNFKDSARYIELYLKSGNLITAEDYNIAGCFLNELYSNITSNTKDAVRSLDYFEKASDLNPSNHLYAKNATIMASKCNDFKRGLKHWKRVLDTGYLTNDDKYDLAAFGLKNKDFKTWKYFFNARFAKENNATVFPRIYGEAWTGKESLTDKTLLVYFEQGFGDTFLMYGYMQRLKQLAKKVIFVVQKAAYPLLKENGDGIEVLCQGINPNDLEYDYWIPSMSIPLALDVDENNLNVGEGYLTPNLERKEYFNRKYCQGVKELKIGLSVGGSKTGDTTRDIDAESLKVLDKIKGIKLYNFTKDINIEEFYRKFKKNKVTDLTKEFESFKDTAAAMANMDIVISTDNVLLNLAGALGIKTYGLFNWNNQFRWFDLTGENVCWLSSVKPFVNDKQNDWSSGLNKMLKDLRRDIREKSKRTLAL